MEVSIEPNERAALFGLGKGHVLVVVDPEWKVHTKIDPAPRRIHVNDFEHDRPLTAQRWRRKLNGLASADRSWRVGRDEPRVKPVAESLGSRQNFPDTVGRSGRDRRGTNVDDHDALGPDVLVQPEHVVRVVLALQPNEAFVLRLAVDLCAISSWLDNIVDVSAG